MENKPIALTRITIVKKLAVIFLSIPKENGVIRLNFTITQAIITLIIVVNVVDKGIRLNPI